MSERIKLSEIRAKFPMYDDLSNDQLIIGLRKKYYSDIPIGEFTKRIEYDTERRDVTKDMGEWDKAAAGFGKALVDTGRGIAGLVTDNSADVVESRARDANLTNTGAGFAGNVTGHVTTALTPGVALKGLGLGATAVRAAGAGRALNTAGNALIAPTSIRGAAGLGAATGALQPAVDLSERAVNTGLGAGASALGTGAVNALARVVRPNTTPAVRALMDEGITPTPGQILGGGFKRAEEGLSSVPYVGDAIKAGQRRAVGDLNTAAFNRALAPIGETLPHGLRGRDAVAHVQATLGDRYEALLPQMTAQADAQFRGEVGNLRHMVENGAIDPNAAQSFVRFLQTNLVNKFQGQGAITGQTLKQIQSDLGEQISRLGASTDADQRLVADALREVQSSLRQLVTRNNPAQAAELAAIDTGYANFKRVQRAAAGLGAEDGTFSPAQLQNAVKAGDRSKDKGRFARGDALMQDLSEPAQTVLGNKLPDSGTPYRSLAALGLGGGLGYAGGVDPTVLGGAAAIPLLFTRPGQNALAALLASRPQAAAPVSNALRRIAPYAAVPAAGFASE